MSCPAAIDAAHASAVDTLAPLFAARLGVVRRCLLEEGAFPAFFFPLDLGVVGAETEETVDDLVSFGDAVFAFLFVADAIAGGFGDRPLFLPPLFLTEEVIAFLTANI